MVDETADDVLPVGSHIQPDDWMSYAKIKIE